MKRAKIIFIFVDYFIDKFEFSDHTEFIQTGEASRRFFTRLGK